MRASFLILAVLLGSLGAVHGASTYSTAVQTADLGWLDQYSLEGEAYGKIGPQACVPTSATNALIYLQNFAPAIFGAALTGTSYEDWVAVDATLVSPDYMNTTLDNGTYFRTIPYALTQFVMSDRGFDSVQFSGMFEPGFWTTQFPKPDYIVDGMPTWSFLYDAFVADTPVMLSIVYANGNGHEILGSGLDWYDANDNGVIDFNENALMSFVDPLDSSESYAGGQPSGGVKITSGHVWYDSSIDGLRLSYDQYQGKLPYDSSDYSTMTVKISNAFVMTVPEPSTAVLCLLGVVAGLSLAWRQRTPSGDKIRRAPSVARRL